MNEGGNCNFGINPFSKALGKEGRLECFLLFLLFFFLLLTQFLFVIIKLGGRGNVLRVHVFTTKLRFFADEGCGYVESGFMDLERA